MKERKIQRSGAEVMTTIKLPREISFQLSRLVLNKGEREEFTTKAELIVRFVKDGLKRELENE